jgi:hypothetical protein
MLPTYPHLSLLIGLFPSGFPANNIYTFLFSPFVPNFPFPTHPPRLDNFNYTWRRVQILKLPVMQFSPPSRHFVSLRSKYYTAEFGAPCASQSPPRGPEISLRLEPLRTGAWRRLQSRQFITVTLSMACNTRGRTTKGSREDLSVDGFTVSMLFMRILRGCNDCIHLAVASSFEYGNEPSCSMKHCGFLVQLSNL